METNKIEWRFPRGNYGTENDLSTSDMETFKEFPITSLAREICQNSIDAKDKSIQNEPVKVEIKSFKIKSSEIPGHDRLLKEIVSCKNYKVNSPKTFEPLEKMERDINKDEITCLRISDFNTTGLTDVFGMDYNSKFYILTKGSGITDKVTGTTGGSKGIGKFASFVTSKFNTVFYSTKTINNEEGYLGIAKLCSTTIDGSDDKTQGIGYYSYNKKNGAIPGQINLDKNFKREKPGTDIYILGFKQEINWKKLIITLVLDSFMLAIFKEKLQVQIDEIIINKNNLKNIIESNDLIENDARKIIESQYTLLTDPAVHKKTVSIGIYGDIELILKAYNKQEEHLATNSCYLIRSPYMKIMTEHNVSTLPSSMLCVIENNSLNKELHNIENPQHTKWEPNRIDDLEKRNEIKKIIKQIKMEIRNFAKEILLTTNNEETDIEGAGEYLPEVKNAGEYPANKKSKNSEIAKKFVRKKNILRNEYGIEENQDSESDSVVSGEYDIDGPEATGITSKEALEKSNEKNNTKSYDPNGEQEVLSSKKLSGMKYVVFNIGTKGHWIVNFISLFEEENCTLKLNSLDNSNNREKVNILSGELNGKKLLIEDGIIKNIKLIKGTRYKFELITDLEKMYAQEVIIYANR